MKRLLLSLLGILVGLPILALDFTYDGVNYTTVGNYVKTKEGSGGVAGGLYYRDETYVSIPSTAIDSHGYGYRVTAIGYESFINKPLLATVKLPKTLEGIGSYAFQNVGISEIIIPSSVNNIGPGAFLACGNLEFAEVQGENTGFGAGVFKNCPVLRKSCNKRWF